MQTASIGRIVHVIVDPASNNGSDVAPAIVVRVWGEPYGEDAPTAAKDGLGERQTVNVRVLLDQRETPWLTSISLFDERPDAAALAAARPYHPTGHNAVAFWPPRA